MVSNTTVDSTDVTVNVNGDYGIYNTEIEDISVFDNSKGIPNFTILSALGGGYAGKVNKSTKVTIDGKTFLHRVYGGGFDPFSTENNKTGQIGGNTEVYIREPKSYGDVFGGGAGVAPKDINGTYTYFTDVAKVLGTTKVEISGEPKIYGNVYGGGDHRQHQIIHHPDRSSQRKPITTRSQERIKARPNTEQVP